MAALAADVADPASLLKKQTAELIASANLSGAEAPAFSKALLGSWDWQSELLDSGPVEKPDEVMRMLFEIWKSDPSLVERPIDRGMACACALESPRRGRTFEQTLPRYLYFCDRWERGYLNAEYGDLSVFDRRYLANGVQYEPLNVVESMDYQNQEVSLPAERYTGACWYARYEGFNHFGDSVQGPLYYAPFYGCWPSQAEVVRNVGGVCGSLSNFGAAAAIANGIPAMTMGEPGHCAYAVRVRPGEWHPSYSLSWQRGPHNAYFGGTWGWHALNTKAYEDPSKARAAGHLRRLAQYYQEKNDSAAAIKVSLKTCAEYPLDWQNWMGAVELLKSSNAPTAQWQELHQDVIKYLAPLSGEVAYNLLQNHIYPQVLPKGDFATDLKKRAAILLTFQKALTNWGLGTWDYAAALNHQLTLLGSDVLVQDQFLAEVFGIHAKANIFTPNILGILLARSGDDTERRQKNIAAIGKKLTTDGGEDYKEIINTLARTVLPDAAKRGDKATFQYVGKLASANYAPCPVIPEPFPGILLSSGGILSIPQPGNRWDNPVTHWGVLEEHGGDFHTNSQPATVTVQLGNFGRLSGVVIVQRNSHFQRLNGAVLQTSADGKEWVDVHTFTNVSQQEQRIDLSDKKIDAGFVRVIRTDPNDCFLHFQKFHVYGRKQN